MARRVKVFFVVLFSACLFSFNVNAEFGITDSVNLSQIEATVNTIENYVQHLDYLFYPYGSTAPAASLYSFLSNLPSISSKLDSISSQLQSILDLLGKSDKDFNTDNAIYCFDSFHFTGNTNDEYPGMIQSDGELVIFDNTGSRYLSTYLPAGEYIFVFQIANLGSWTNIITFETNSEGSSTPNDFLQIKDGTLVGVFGNVKRYYSYFTVPEGGLTWGDMWLGLDHSGGYACGYIFSVEGAEGIISDALTPSIDSTNSSLSDGVNQLDSLEDQVFGSLDTSLGSIDFSGSALGQVVSGFSFIRAVFSAIYSSSPYISVLINLSCMFGVLALFLRVQPRFSRWEREHRDRSD